MLGPRWLAPAASPQAIAHLQPSSYCAPAALKLLRLSHFFPEHAPHTRGVCQEAESLVEGICPRIGIERDQGNIVLVEFIEKLTHYQMPYSGPLVGWAHDHIPDSGVENLVASGSGETDHRALVPDGNHSQAVDKSLGDK